MCISVAEDSNVVADGSLDYCLPRVDGKHQDLQSISPDTLTNLINGEYQETIGRFLVVDCRYPYEYNGGHIQGAVNCFTKDDMVKTLIASPLSSPDENRRTVVVFHCEFSSERGPKM